MIILRQSVLHNSITFIGAEDNANRRCVPFVHQLTSVVVDVHLHLTEILMRIGEGDSICEISHELVLDNWQSVPHTIPQECPFRWQIIRQHRKAVRRR